MKSKSITVLLFLSFVSTQARPQVTTNTPALAQTTTTEKSSAITTTEKAKSTTLKEEIRIHTLDKETKDIDQSKSGKKELDNPSKIIDLHKTTAEDDKNHEVSGRKGVDPSTDVVTEISHKEVKDHVQDLHNLKNPVTTTTTSTTTSTTTESAKAPAPVVNDNTPKTSLLVGIILACILLTVLVFVGFKRLEAIRRRREYRRMNDFLVDGMYNEM